MEYLMTYGWALLVIVIVIAVLLYINPFKAPEQCTFDQAGLYCERPILFVVGKDGSGVDVPGLLSARITNGERRTITVGGVACIRGTLKPKGGDVRSQWSSDFLVNLGASPADNEGKDLAPQESMDLRNFDNNADKTAQNYVRCLSSVTKDTDGNADLSVTLDDANTKLRQGEDFSGRLYVAYRYADEPKDAPYKVVGANLVTRAQ